VVFAAYMDIQARTFFPYYFSDPRQDDSFGIGMTDADAGYTGGLKFHRLMVFQFAGQIKLALVGNHLTQDTASRAGANGCAFDRALLRTDQTDGFYFQCFFNLFD